MGESLRSNQARASRFVESNISPGLPSSYYRDLKAMLAAVLDTQDAEWEKAVRDEEELEGEPLEAELVRFRRDPVLTMRALVRSTKRGILGRMGIEL